MKASTLVLSPSLAALAALTACTAAPAGDARFATADAAHLRRAFHAATGGDEAAAMALVRAIVAAPAGAACPQITRAGTSLTAVATGCAGAGGTVWAGRVRLDNLAGQRPADPTRPLVVTFDALSARGGAFDDVLVDGTLRESAATSDVALIVTDDGIAVESVLSLSHPAGGLVTIQPGATVDVDGVGGARLSGAWTFADGAGATDNAGAVTLGGADTLRFDVRDIDDAGCVPYAVGAAAGTLCGA